MCGQEELTGWPGHKDAGHMGVAWGLSQAGDPSPLVYLLSFLPAASKSPAFLAIVMFLPIHRRNGDPGLELWKP